MRWKKEGSEGGKGVYVTQFQTNFSSMQFHSQVVQVCVMMHGHSSVDTGDVSHRNQSSGNSQDLAAIIHKTQLEAALP